MLLHDARSGPTGRCLGECPPRVRLGGFDLTKWIGRAPAPRQLGWRASTRQKSGNPSRLGRAPARCVKGAHPGCNTGAPPPGKQKTAGSLRRIAMLCDMENSVLECAQENPVPSRMTMSGRMEAARLSRCQHESFETVPVSGDAFETRLRQSHETECTSTGTGSLRPSSGSRGAFRNCSPGTPWLALWPALAVGASLQHSHRPSCDETLLVGWEDPNRDRRVFAANQALRALVRFGIELGPSPA